MKRAPLLLAALCSCGGPRIIEVQPPADVAWIVVLLDRAGEDTEVIGPLRWGPGVRFSFGDRGAPDSVRVAGWPDASLASVFGSGPATGRAKLATGCDALMPAPTFAARQDPGGATSEIAASSLPALAAEGLTCPNTPERLDSVWIEVHCPGVSHCRPKAVREGCRLVMQFDDCDLATIKGTVVARGDALCLPASGAMSACVPTEPKDDEWAALDCGQGLDCRVSFFRPPEQPFLAVKTVPVLNGATPRIPPAAARGDPLALDGREGYLSDLVVLSDRLVVASYEGAFGGPWCALESDPAKRRTRLHFFELDTLMPTGTATAPDCLRMVADPTGTGFIGVFGSNNLYDLARFDARGRRLQEVGPAGIPITAPPLAIGAIELTETPQRVAIAFTQTSTVEANSTVLFYDPRTLGQTSGIGLGRTHTRGLTAAGPGRVAVLESQLRRVRLLGVENGSIINDFYLTQNDEKTYNAIFIGYAAPRNDFLLADAGLRRAILHYSAAGGVPGAVPLSEYSSTPSALIRWPGAGDLQVTTFLRFVTPSEPEAVVTLYDPAKRKYYPGAQRVGFGPTWRLRGDGRTRVYAIQPWSGEVAKITAR